MSSMLFLLILAHAAAGVAIAGVFVFFVCASGPTHHPIERSGASRHERRPRT